MDKQTANTLTEGQPVRLVISPTWQKTYYFKALDGDNLVLWTAPEKEYHIKAHHKLVHVVAS